MSSTLSMARGEQESGPHEKVEPERMQLWYSLMKSTLLCCNKSAGMRRWDNNVGEKKRKDPKHLPENVSRIGSVEGVLSTK